MRIKSIDCIIVDLPTTRPHKLAMATINSHNIVLIRIRNEDGREGVGEAAVIPHYSAETVEGIKSLIDLYLAPSLVGFDPSYIEALNEQMDALIKGNLYAKSAVEMACVDLVARTLNVPASVLFGGAVRERLQVLWALGSGNADQDIAEAELKIEQKLHNLFLVKVGGGDVRDDVRRVIAVKRAVGNDVKVHVDVNQYWDEPTATWAIERLEAAGIAVIEQPLPRANLEGMRRLAQRFSVPIMADEAVDTLESALDFAKAHAADAFSIKLTKHGGLLRTKKLVAVAEAAGISLFGGTMLETAVGTSASAQLFSTISRLDWGCELFGPLLLKDTITIEQPVYQDFHLVVPNGPGYGATIDEDKLAFYRRDKNR